MKENIKFYNCPTCKNVVELLEGEIKNITCCQKQMELMKPNTVDASKEKHVPVYEKKEDEIIVRVGEEKHPMEENHYITWIALVKDDTITRINLQPNKHAEVKFPYIKNSTIYACCNNHGLWKKEVE